MAAVAKPIEKKQKTRHRVNGQAQRPAPRRVSGSGRPFTVVESLRKREPKWLPSVVFLRKLSTPLAIGSLAIVLPLYGLNVLLEREWGEKYAQLELTLHRQGTLVAQSERRKYQIPRELEIDSKNFVPQNQDNTLFLTPEPARPLRKDAQPQRQSSLSIEQLPVGY